MTATDRTHAIPGVLTHYYDAEHGPYRYIEAQVWADEPLNSLDLLP